jgi:hypothetical protein
MLAEHSELLTIFAQLFIAFAGFSGVVAAFSTIRLSPEVTIFRVRALVVVALLSLTVSLLPFLAEAFGASDLAALRICSLVFALAMCGFVLWGWPRLSSLISAGLLGRKLYALVLPLMLLPAALIVLGLVAVSGGLVRDVGAAIYLSGLYFALVLCSYYFVVVILAVEIKTRK